MARSCMRLLAYILLIYALPDRLIAAELELRQAGSGASDVELLVGEEIDVELWIDSVNQELSGAAVFLTFDESVFALSDQDRQSVSTGFQPFSPGQFLRNGEVFRNDLLDPDDPASQAPGTQLDYSVVRATDRGAGLVASFRLRAIAPSGKSQVRIDEIGIRETRVFLPDGSQRAFRFITPLTAQVRGITLEGLPSTLVLARGEPDTTTLSLGDHIFDPVHAVSAIRWAFPANTSLSLDHETDSGRLRIAAGTEAAAWERLVITATNPDGQSVTDTIDVFVNAAPALDPAPATARVDEDATIEVPIAVHDPDTSVELLTLEVLAPPELGVRVDGPPFVARLSPAADWNGEGTISIVATDNFGFADTTAIQVEVVPVNDPPVLLVEPNVRLTRGKRDSSLTLAGLLHDPDEAASDLRLSWSRADRVLIHLRDGRLVLESRDGSWLGEEEILLTVEDRDGLTDSALLTVDVVPSLPPILVDAPRRYGLASGDYVILGLNDLVVDPDDVEEELTWKVSGNDHLQVQFNSQGQARIEAPPDFAGSEILEFTVSDPSGEATGFALLVMAAPKDGSPVFADLPDISLPIDGVDSSIDLDDFVFDVDHGMAELEWSVSANGVGASIDPVTHVLTIIPTTATAGDVVLQLEVRDPDANATAQTITVHLTGREGEPTADFSLVPLEDFSLQPGKVTALDLDDLVRGDLDPEQIGWSVEGAATLVVEIDSESRLATISAGESWQEQEFLTFVATFGPLTRRLTVEISPATSAPDPGPPAALSPFPAVVVKAGDFDQSILLDEFISGVDPAELTWEVTGAGHMQIVIDTDTRRLIILADADWDGIETLTLVARHADGTTLQSALDVRVLPLTNALGVRALTHVTLFAGEHEIRIALDDLMPGHGDVSALTWEADASQALTTRYEADSNVLVFESLVPWRFSDIITLTVRDSDGAEASGQVVIQVEAADGTAGETTPDFRVAIVPNVFQPDFLDIFVISEMELQRQPLLRLQDEHWNDLLLATSSSGIWYGDHVLTPGLEGQVQVLALGIAGDDRLVKAEMGLSLGTVQPAAGKRLANDRVSLYLPPDSFGEEAVVAVFPGAMIEPDSELVPISDVYTVHSPQQYEEQQESRIGFEIGDLATTDTATLGVYRWDASTERWAFAGAGMDDGHIVAPVARLGRFALMSDPMAPRLLAVEESATDLSFAWQDLGSGIGGFTVQFDGRPIFTYQVEGDRLILSRDDLPHGSGILSVRAVDLAGNRSARAEHIVAASYLPHTFALEQNYPNPFNPSTAIPFFLPNAAAVDLRVYDAAGQQVRHLLDRSVAGGRHEVVWDTTNDRGVAAASGLYFYRLQIGGRSSVRKMTLIR